MHELGKRAAKTLSHMGKGAGKNKGKKGQPPRRDIAVRYARSQTPPFPTWMRINWAMIFLRGDSSNVTPCAFKIFTKNAKLNNRLEELFGELSFTEWDVVLFSETRSVQGSLILEGGHWLHTTDEPTGAAVLIHARHGNRIKKVGRVGRRCCAWWTF